MTKNERLWNRYWAIRDEHRNGFATPILWHLALRRDPNAMTELGSTFASPGRIADAFSQAGLAYRAHRMGFELAGQHLAMNGFNRRDLTTYRRWLARAAQGGNQDSRRELRRFETRLSHRNARLIGRQRPYRKSDWD